MDLSEPHTLTREQVSSVLANLKLALEGLPTELPRQPPANSKYAAFLHFGLDPDVRDKAGDEVAAMGEQFEQIFGFKARTTGDGILPIEERGESITSVHDVLQSFFKKFPDNDVLKKWIVDILKGAAL